MQELGVEDEGMDALLLHNQTQRTGDPNNH